MLHAGVRIVGEGEGVCGGFCCVSCNEREQFVAFSIFPASRILQAVDGISPLRAGSPGKSLEKDIGSQPKENSS